MFAIGTKRTSVCVASMSALEVKRASPAPEGQLLTLSGHALLRCMNPVLTKADITFCCSLPLLHTK